MSSFKVQLLLLSLIFLLISCEENVPTSDATATVKKEEKDTENKINLLKMQEILVLKNQKLSLPLKRLIIKFLKQTKVI